MSQEPSYWTTAFRPFFTSYSESDYRTAPIDRSHYIDEIDDHDFRDETRLSIRMGARLYKAPYTINYPRECAKFIDKYYACRKELGIYSIVEDSPAQCNSKKAAIFEECPHWVIENMAAKRKFYKRAEMIDNLTYQRAMEVSDYNK